LISDCQKTNFVSYYFSPESISLFERIYYKSAANSLQDTFVAYWKKVAARFASNPYVIGYDPINEPFPSNIYTNPELWYDVGRFDGTVLQPLYSRIFEEAYAPASDSKIMFFEPGQFPDTVFHTGFTALPAGNDKPQLHIFNDHSYSPCALTDKSDLTFEEVCRVYHL